MKKLMTFKAFLVLLFMAAITVFTGCNFKTTVSGDIGIPSHVGYIEFWNGGACIGMYENATVATKIDTAEQIVGKSISFYRYEVTVEGKTDIIIDSEALAIKYRE
jgi:hypothetical protein